MPQTAALVDWLRGLVGKDEADRIVLGGKQGRGTFWARETGPDGITREFGSRPPAPAAAFVQPVADIPRPPRRDLVPGAAGRAHPLAGPPTRGRPAGNSAPVRSPVAGAGKSPPPSPKRGR